MRSTMHCWNHPTSMPTKERMPISLAIKSIKAQPSSNSHRSLLKKKYRQNLKKSTRLREPSKLLGRKERISLSFSLKMSRRLIRKMNSMKLWGKNKRLLMKPLKKPSGWEISSILRKCWLIIDILSRVPSNLWKNSLLWTFLTMNSFIVFKKQWNKICWQI